MVCNVICGFHVIPHTKLDMDMDDEHQETGSEPETNPQIIQNEQNEQEAPVYKLDFPWPKVGGVEWEDLCDHFKDWTKPTHSTYLRRNDLDALLKSMHKRSYSQLSCLTNTFFAREGPLTLMVESVLQAPSLFSDGQVRTSSGVPSTLVLSKRKAFTICSLAFFGLFPKYNYSSMFFGPPLARCMGNYYERAYREFVADPTWFEQTITIERRVLNSTIAEPKWKESTVELAGLAIQGGKKGIEDFRNCDQVNFADPYPGGTLPSSHGDIVQEEILFAIYPELFITPLLVPRIGTQEAVIVSGLTRTNKYKGYQHSFDFAGDYSKDNNLISIIFMDALPGGVHNKNSYKRDLNKAFLGFSWQSQKPIATGHWGCGAFGGNRKLKSILQLMAAAQAGKDLIYATYDRPLPGFQEFYDEMKELKATVGEIYVGLLNAIQSGNSDFYNAVTKHVVKLRNKTK